MVTVHCDSTIAMPMLIPGLSENLKLIRVRKKAAFSLGRELKFSFPS
jgi:hypothetical protein